MVVCFPIQTFIWGVIKMNISITDEIISQFLSGVLTICAMIMVGGTLALLLRGMNRNFNFTRLSLILGLAPLSLVSFMDPKSVLSLVDNPEVEPLAGEVKSRLERVLAAL